MKILLALIILIPTLTFSKPINISCKPDKTLENNNAGGLLTLIIDDDNKTVYRSFDDSYITNFVDFNDIRIINKLPAGNYAFIDRVSGHYKILKNLNNPFSTAVWKCEKVNNAF